MKKPKFLNRIEIVRAGDYTLKVHSKQSNYNGDGLYLDITIFVSRIWRKKLSPLEKFAVNHEIIIWEDEMEITGQSLKEVRQSLKIFTDSIRKNPTEYLRELEERAKEVRWIRQEEKNRNSSEDHLRTYNLPSNIRPYLIDAE